MGKPVVGEAQGSPEKLVARLAAHLQKHLLWDSLLLSFPPLLAFFSIWAFVYRSDRSGRGTMIFAGVVLLGSALGLGILRLRAALPSLRVAARLIDERVAGQDRFVTLATMSPSLCPPLLWTRLRQEAAAIGHRLDLERDFPYHFKRSFFQSLIVSLSVILLSLLVVQFDSIFARRALPADELTRWSQRLSQVSRFTEPARSLEALAARLRESGVTNKEKRSLVQEMVEQLERQLVVEQQLGGEGADLLSQAAEALRGLEQGLEKSQEGDASGLRNKSLRKEKGSGGGSGEGEKQEERGELSGLTGTEVSGKESGGEKPRPGEKEADREQGRGEKEGKDKSKEVKGTGKEESGGKGSRNMDEEIPRGRSAERFLKPGEEGERGIKGARFVTVELPEEETGGEAGRSGPGKRREIRPKTPVSNVPLRQPDASDASPERQPLPLEYRGLIR